MSIEHTDIYAVLLLAAVCLLIGLNRRYVRKKHVEQQDDDVNWL